MRISPYALVATVLLSSSLALAEPPCPPGAFCEELPETFDDTEPEEADLEEAEPEEAEPEEAEPEEAEPTPVPDPPTERAAPPVLASERSSWAPVDADAPRPADPTYGNDAENVGVGIFAASYGIPFFVGLVAAAASDENPDAAPLIPLMLPVVGPVITGAIYDVSAEGYGLLAAAGGVQAVGLIIWAIGASLPDDPRDTATLRPTPNGLMVRF